MRRTVLVVPLLALVVLGGSATASAGGAAVDSGPTLADAGTAVVRPVPTRCW